MIASVAPVWDGNQTWLVGGGAALFAAFPKAYHLLLSALYLPIIAMLLALVFRGVTFEFRGAARTKTLWNAAFIGGSTLAAFCQGLILGTWVLGFEYDGKQLVFGAWDFLSPFSLLVGVGLVADYALLGACWLILKTEGELQAWAYRCARRVLPLVVLNVVLVCLWMPFKVPAIFSLWFGWPGFILLSPIPLWSCLLIFILYRMLKKPPKADWLPFACCLGLYLLALAGLGVSTWPYVVPRALSLWDVAGPSSSLLFTMVGVLLIVPVILVYTAHSYYVFRGKVRLEDSYH
jgi:cytochrome d ubiquinol oxidase subunit II